jgi:tRNA (guanine37-N1)-methyltransferase
MKINILTIFPKLFDSFLNETLIKKALQAKLLEINIVDIRQYATDKHHTTDDTPYGGGPGMVMKVEPIFRALEALKKSGMMNNDKRIMKTALMSPRGRQFSQSVVEEYAKLDEITLICGRYEGVDYRVTEHLVDEELSIGPYVMSGGEVPAMVVMEAVSRYVPGVLGNAESLIEETFSLRTTPYTLPPTPSREYPQYTKPEDFNGWKVPEVLLSGNHAEIRKWRESQVK